MLPSDIEIEVEKTRGRQRRLTTGMPPLTLRIVLTEGVLGNGFGSRDLMCGQLEQLITFAGLPGVDIRIMLSGLRAGPRALPPFTCLSFPALQTARLPDTVLLPGIEPVYLKEEADAWPYSVAFDHLWMASADEAETVPVLKRHRSRWAKPAVTVA